jgi:hypothetical protein
LDQFTLPGWDGTNPPPAVKQSMFEEPHACNAD